jgi:myo-inositol-1(or 4)-monophosphatase
MTKNQKQNMLNLTTTKNDLEQLLKKVGVNVKKGFTDKNKEVTFKKDENDLLTKYDTQANNAILKYLEANYPDISIISEEAKEISKKSEYSFVVDPIDGTRNFVRNIPIFFIGIGLVKNNQTLMSITYNPMSKEIFWAIKGQGAFKNNLPIKISERKLSLSDLSIRISPDKNLEKKVVNKIISSVNQIRNESCCHYELSGVASGRLDGFISQGSSAWDHCHYLLVKEAGGKVTDWQGRPFDVSKNNIVASNAVIHEELLQALK